MATEQQESVATPGNSGAWYLELVGVEVPAELRNGAGGGNGSVGQLWGTAGGSDILDGWTPEALSPTVTSSRRFRWTVVVLLLLAGLLAVGALLVVPAYVENQAEGLNQEYRSALLDLNADLAPTQLVLDRATDPTESLTDIGAAAVTLSALSESAANVRDLARQDLPSSPPLTPRDSLLALQPARNRMIEVGGFGLELSRRITAVVDYEAAAANILDVPSLPLVANELRISDLSIELAAIQAETADALTELPDDPALAGHKSLAYEAQARLGPWQSEYLESLRTGDRITARALINELADSRASLDAALDDAKAVLRALLDTSLVTLAQQVEATLILLPR